MQSLPKVAYRRRLTTFPGRLGTSLPALVKAEGIGLVVLTGALDWLLAIDIPLLVVQ